ncbi:MAG TPA: beta-galactosidase family protein [Fimbriimonas sp.]|nr:beta-galactosidase family protein [Fimbriimonas sp.]
MSLLLLAGAVLAISSPPKHTFRAEGSQLLLDGKPFQIRCGEMHYPRVPREYWRDRFKKMRAMGLNTVCTYAFWNLHEPKPNQYDFSGNNDIAEFVREAQQEGLWVLLRPGPYSCAEWEWGGFPYWLARIPNIKVRTSDPRFVKAATDYLHHLGEQLAPLQVTHGGPILMVQVENEYGSFGSDMTYKRSIEKALKDAGFDTQLYTADGPSDSMLAGGTLPDVLPVANFGGDPAGAFKELEKFRPGTPKMCGEFYPGWFDSWGKPHAHTSTEALAKDIETMEDEKASYSLYMVHGGTTFGFMNGANWYDNGYWPQTTSYDYSTTIDEAGRPTDKFYAFRKVVQAHLAPGEILPDPPPAQPVISIPPIDMKPTEALFDIIGKPVKSEQPKSFEDLDQAYGFVLYRTYLKEPIKGSIEFQDLRDRAQIFVDGGAVGTAYRGDKPQKFDLDAPEGSRLDILVENMGRINYGPRLIGEHAGLGPVLADGKPISGWEMYKLPFDEAPAQTAPAHTIMPGVPAVFKGTFNLSETGDTFLDTRAWTKGVAWINGHNLGRFWSEGPQQTLYVPGPWLKKGENELIVLELEPKRKRTRSIAGLTDSVFGLQQKK